MKEPKTVQDKIKVALDIFEHSTSREYLISLQRFHKEITYGNRAQPAEGTGGLGLVNLTERRGPQAPPKIEKNKRA